MSQCFNERETDFTPLMDTSIINTTWLRGTQTNQSAAQATARGESAKEQKLESTFIQQTAKKRQETGFETREKKYHRANKIGREVMIEN